MKLTLRNCCLLLITMLLASYAGMGLGLLPGVTFPMQATLFGSTGDQHSATTRDGVAKLNQGSSSVNEANWAPPPLAIGDDYQGGKIGYILQPGDPGYDANEVKGLIFGPTLGAACTWSGSSFYSTSVGSTSDAIGSGAANTALIVNQNGAGDYAAYRVDTLTLGGYTDWYLGSSDELLKILGDTSLGLGMMTEYWSSSQLAAPIGKAIYYRNTFSPWGTTFIGKSKSLNALVLPVRSFIQSTCNPTSSSTIIAACGSYTWNGQTYTSSGTYTWTGTNAAGCDSTATLKLDIINNNDSLVVGASMFGGKIGYILQAGDPGYDATKIKGLVVGTNDFNVKQWAIGTYESNWTNVTGRSLGSGAANTTTLVSLMGPGNYYAYAFDTLKLGGYTDWFLPSSGELSKILPNYQALGIQYNNYMFYSGTPSYLSSTDHVDTTNQNPSSIALFSFRSTGLDSSGSMAKNTIMTGYARPVRSFEVTPCVPPCNPTTSFTAVAACKNYTWNGQTYTSSGSYTWTGTNAAGCDSTATLKLDIINNNDSLVVGASMFGGKIGYILQAGDPGYDATKIKGLVVGAADFLNGFWATANYLSVSTNVTDSGFGKGAANTAALVNLMGNPNNSPNSYLYSAYITDTLTLAGYTDWYLPSSVELERIFRNAQYLDVVNYLPYVSSTEINSNQVNGMIYALGVSQSTTNNKDDLYNITRPVRSFEVTPCVPPCNPTTSFTAVAACKNYTWNGQTYTSSGTYTWTGINAGGCDSTATLKLDIINNNDSLVVGASMFGGKIGYILQAGDPGYDATKIKGLVVGAEDYLNKPWGLAYNVTGVVDSTLGAGSANTAALARIIGPGNYAAYTFDTLSSGGYADWYLPSRDEMVKIMANYAILNIQYITNSTYYYQTSSEIDFISNYIVAYLGPLYGSMVNAAPSSKTMNNRARPVRSFEVTPCVVLPPSTPADVVVIPTITGGVVNFTAPANDGGAAITNYEYSIDNGANWVTPSPAVTSGSLTISGLASCTDYQVKIRAVNAAGIGTETSAVTLSTRESKLPGDAWIKSYMGTSISWNGIAYGNGTFVTVARSPYPSRRVATSPDGVNWTEGNVGVFNDGRNWQDVAYGNGLFVAVASSAGTGNRVMTSPDGITWTDRSSAADNNWSSVTYGNGLFVAVATSGTGNRVMTSPDGINWSARSSAADIFWYDVTYGNGLFVAVAAYSGSGNRVMTSPDGINWTSRTSSDDYEWVSVTYGNGLFVAVSQNAAQNKVMTSADGINWTSSTTLAKSWRHISFGGGKFVVIAGSGSTEDIMTSPDGINWTAITTEEYSDLVAVVYANEKFVIASSIGDVYTSTFTVSADAPVIDSINVATDSLSVSFIQTLPTLASAVTGYEYSVDNGANWIAKSAADTTSPLRIGGLAKGYPYQVKLRALNIGGTSCESAMVNFCLPATSSDTVDVCSSYTWNGQTYTASGVYADTLVSKGGCDSIATLHLTIRPNPTSPTNLVATPINEGVMIQFTAPAGSSSYTTYEYSINNGSSWIIPDTAISASPVIISGLTNCNDYLVKIRAVTSCSTSDASESLAVTPRPANVPGIDWVMSPYQANPSYSEFYKIVYGNGIYVATSQDYTNNPVVTSTDGINWSPSSPGTTLGLYAITFDGNRFVGLTGENSGNKIAISQDGINWTVSDLNVTFKASSITYGNGMYVAVSNRGVGDQIMSSPDALNWTIRTSPTTNYFGSVTWGNGLFVALSNTGTSRIITSPDGINWTAQVAPTTSSFGKLIFGNGIFMASSFNGGTNSIMTSPDGINWSLQTTPRTATSIAYGNNLFVAVGNSGSGNRVMTSPDGINWTQGKSAGDYNWTDVAYGDGKFVALSLFGPNVSMVSTFSPAADAPIIDSVSVINLDSVTVHFSQTKPDLASAVTNYEYSLDNGSNWSAISPANAVSPLGLKGFSPGVTYQTKIRAINSAGASCESNAVAVSVCAPTSSVDSVTACDSYVWHDSTYTSSTNSATWVTTNANGCDSTITLILTITPKLKWFKDNDGDGFGAPTDSTYACTQPNGYVANNTDCNDGDKKTSPNKYWYKDKDGDGHGSKRPEDRKQSCEKPKRDDDKLFVPGDYVDNDLDCNDDDSTINGNTIWYKDVDSDGYGTGDTLMVCEQPTGYRLLKDMIAATGDCDDTNATIYPNSSTAATSILASSTSVTVGGSITLSVNGGSLGASDTWKWYTGSCGGTAIGSGTSIVVSPAVTTIYYLRAEGCTNTNCVSVTITACGPTGVKSNAANNTICSGTSTTLTVQGVLAGAASWKWYKNACGYDESRSDNEGAIGTGASLKVSPTSTTTYYVRSEGGICGKTSCKSITITVNPKPAKPVSMTVPAKICKQATIQLTVGAVNSATSYKWTVPKGWSIVSGQGTRTVVVKTGTASAVVKVAAVNSCGSSAVYTKRITLGNCKANSSAVLVTSAIRPVAGGEVDTDAALNIQTYPNPSTNYFTVRNNNSFVIQLRMVQASGQVVEAFSQVQPGAAVEFGARYRPGIYLVEATGNGLKTTKKVIKH